MTVIQLAHHHNTLTPILMGSRPGCGENYWYHAVSKHSHNILVDKNARLLISIMRLLPPPLRQLKTPIFKVVIRGSGTMTTIINLSHVLPS